MKFEPRKKRISRRRRGADRRRRGAPAVRPEVRRRYIRRRVHDTVTRPGGRYVHGGAFHVRK